VAHARVKLTPFGRRLLVDRVLLFGWTQARAAESMGVSGATASKWIRAKNYLESRGFAAAVQTIGATHRPTRGYRPQTNGKAERFIRTMLTEWAYVRLYRSNDERLRALPMWVDHYSRRRPHTALGGTPPMGRL